MSKLVEAIIDSCMLVSEGLVDDAERNLRNSGLFDEDSDYMGWLGQSVLELIKVFADQGHSGASAMRTLELFDQVARRKPLTAAAWDAEHEHLMQWLKDEGQLDGEHAMDDEMVQSFLDSSIGSRPMTESLIEQVMNGASAADALTDVLSEGLASTVKSRYPVGSQVEFAYVHGYGKQYVCHGTIKKYDGDVAVIKDSVVVQGKKVSLPSVIRTSLDKIYKKVGKAK